MKENNEIMKRSTRVIRRMIFFNQEYIVEKFLRFIGNGVEWVHDLDLINVNVDSISRGIEGAIKSNIRKELLWRA